MKKFYSVLATSLIMVLLVLLTHSFCVLIQHTTHALAIHCVTLMMSLILITNFTLPLYRQINKTFKL